MIRIIRPPYLRETELVSEIENFLRRYEEYSSLLSSQGVEELTKSLKRVAKLVDEVETANHLHEHTVGMLDSIKLQSLECARFLDSVGREITFHFSLEYAITKAVALVQTELESYLIKRTDYRGFEDNSVEMFE